MISYSRFSGRLFALTAASIVWAALPASALTAPAVSVADAAGDSITVDSTGALSYTGLCSPSTCLSTSFSFAAGEITWSGTIGNGTPLNGLGPFMFLNLQGQTTGTITNGLDLGLGSIYGPAGQPLTVSLTVTNLAITGPLTFTVINPGVSSTVYVDPSNTPFGITSPAVAAAQFVAGCTQPCTENMIPFTASSPSSSVTEVAMITIPANPPFTSDLAFYATALQSTPGSPLGKGDAATIGFWHNKNGQAVIDCVQPQGALGNWLAATIPALYGLGSPNNMTGKNDAAVAALFMQQFGVSGQKTYAQILATALAVYVTDTSLAQNCGQKFGFNLSSAGVGGHTYNVGTDGAAVGLNNNTSYTLLALLKQVNLDSPLSTAEFNAFNDIFSNINQDGDIQ